MDNSIINEKLDQAVALLKEKEIGAWLTFARETSLTSDPCLEMVAGLDMTWHSAFLVSRSGERIAIVGRFDAGNIRALGGYTEVVPYDESIRPALREVIARLDPESIALNYSESDPAADGLTHGMHLTLLDTFRDTPYAHRFRSAESFVAALRGRKSPSEIGRIRAAIKTTEEMYAMVSGQLRPGLAELEIAGWLHDACRELGHDTAWDKPYCPTVNAGPDSPVGHVAPGERRTQRGHLLHIDFGVKQDGFCSDIQRMWYFRGEGEEGVPPEIERAWPALWGAIDAGAALLKPGAIGWEVDAAARAYIVGQGYPEYRHALGHHVGRAVHDGSSLLGPRWDRYGQTPYGVVEAGNVFTLELGAMVEGRGFIGLEEDVLVTESGIEWLSTPQRDLWIV